MIRNHPFANITFAVVLLMGMLSYNMMPRERDPEINFNWLVVTVALPGASAQDVEKKITDPLEDAIARIPDIRFVSSTSREGIASILVRFRDIPERVYDKRINDMRREVQTAADRELPRDATRPEVFEITTSNGFPTAMILVEGNDFDETLRSHAYRIKSDLERMPGVDKVLTTGLSDPELQIEFRPDALAARGLSAADLADSVAGWFRDTPAGRVRVGDDEWLLRVVGQDSDPDYLAGLTVFQPPHSAQAIPIEAVAEVARGREKAGSLVSRKGRPGVLLAVNKKNYTNTLELVQHINGYLAQQGTRIASSGVQLTLLDDQTVPTRQAISLMERNALQGLILVLFITWLFLGSRIATLIALGIPFSLLGTFWILNGLGYTLNLTVLLGVIISLGMLVDDAVVIVEDMYFRIARGESALESALNAIRSVGLPVLASVLTTIAAFLPLMLLPGIIGDFMKVVPFVVTLALLISLLEAFWMLPTHVVALRMDFSRPSRLHVWRTNFTHLLRLRYSRWLLWSLRHARKTLAIIVMLFVLAVGSVVGGLVKTNFFAFDPMRLFYVSLDMPPGTAIETTLHEAERLEVAVRKHLRPEETRAVASYAGVKFTDTEPLYGDAYGQTVVSLLPRVGDMRDADVIVEAMRKEIESLPLKGKVSFFVMSGGPPSSKPVKLRLRGDDYAELRRAADALRAKVAAVPGIRDLGDDDLPGRHELVLQVDGEAVKATGLSPMTVARLVRLHSEGEIVAAARSQGEKIEVRVRALGRPLDDVEDALAVPVALPNGGTTTLASLVTTESRIAKGVIKHYDLRRAITIEADLDKTVTDTLAANALAREAWNNLSPGFPGVSVDYSGEMDDIQESLDSMLLLFLLGVGLIYLILATQFRSYWQPLMIISTVPMAFTGVAFGLLLSGNPLSLYTLYGVIALVGIAVNSAIVLIDAANQRRADGMSIIHAAVYAARRRVVPILITTTTTIGGLLSLALGLGGKSLIWGPVASAIVFGLSISTVLTLFVMPLLYVVVMKPHRHS
ncbi:MAG: efflux RND transporter permease subunit [Nitrosomonadales bacterium]|nr:efflux RND transporter permease subunit [Nitrosomonadales bacterium]